MATKSQGKFFDERKLNEEFGSLLGQDRDVCWDAFLQKMKYRTPSVIEGIQKKVLDIHPSREGFQLFNVLTPEECEYFIAQTEDLGYQKLTGYSGSYRTNTRRIIHYEGLRDVLWERVGGFMTADLPDKMANGTWHAYGLNPQFRFCKYEPGQHFSPHYDANFSYSSVDKSFYTFMIYLNGGFEGGATNFLADSNSDARRGTVLESLAPEPGMLLVFQHNIFHEAEALKSGLKYMMRSDVMYKLESKPRPELKKTTTDSSSSSMPESSNPTQNADDDDESQDTAKRMEAIELIHKAEQLEFQGKPMEAVALYKKAYKMVPELENPNSFADSPVLDSQP